ncbi:MAG TPA: amidohydrolase family protein [Candidatus Binataceae bacterium]|nr:amidohydrolase family protein [Candidatus Binataceae bacterium]
MAAVEKIPVIDCDGHVVETLPELAEFMDPTIRYVAETDRPFPSGVSVFPSLDGLHYQVDDLPRTALFENPKRKRVTASANRAGSAADWIALLGQTPIEQTVLFTSDGLSMGWLRQREYTIRICRAYNDYMAARFAIDRRLHPMAIIPMQFPEEAVKELRRAVKELGLLGAMVPSTGLPLHLGHEFFWPVYKEASDLECALAVHGGCNGGIGLDSFDRLLHSHILHHPVPLMIAFVATVCGGLFERFPGLRIAFLEGGVGWVAMLYDRIERERELGAGENLELPQITKYLESNRVLVGCEGNDQILPYLVKTLGARGFGYSSDYPHEADLVDVKREIDETLENHELSRDDKAAILGGNAREFYRLGV